MTASSDLQKDYNEIEAAYQAASRDDFLLFTKGLIIPSVSGPQVFRPCMAPFQLECFQSLAPSLHAVRDGTKPSIRRFWIERTKKAGKDSDLAVCLVWLMAYPSKPLLVQVCAANQKQARIVEDRAIELLYLNPWLHERIEIIQASIRNKGMPREVRVLIEATGAPGAAQGPTPDLLVLNELVHVDKWAVMEAHMGNADGVPRGVVIILTNAGVKGTRAELWRKNAIKDKKRWNVQIWHKRSPWVNQEDVDEAKKRDPIGSEYKRLWEGRWISGIGDALNEEDIDFCFSSDMKPHTKPREGWQYIAGLDLGVTRDHSGLVVLAVNPVLQEIHLAKMKVWLPEKSTGEVDLIDVEKSCFSMHVIFHLFWFGYDPTQAKLMSQRLVRRGVPMKEVSFASPKNLTKMAESLVQAVAARKLFCYDDRKGTLRRDFGKFNIEHKPPSRYKLQAVSDEHGHADVGTALVIALMRAVDMLSGRVGLQPGDELAESDEESLVEVDVEGLPSELRDIYEGISDPTIHRKHRSEFDDF